MYTMSIRRLGLWRNGSVVYSMEHPNRHVGLDLDLDLGRDGADVSPQWGAGVCA